MLKAYFFVWYVQGNTVLKPARIRATGKAPFPAWFPAVREPGLIYLGFIFHAFLMVFFFRVDIPDVGLVLCAV